MAARYNVAPSQKAHVITRRSGKRQATQMTWGIVPMWEKSPSVTTGQINARSETIAEKPTFRDSFVQFRCLVPADGWFEWIESPDGKRTMYVRRADAEPFAMAGLYSVITTTQGETLTTFTIITKEASPEIAVIHDRMPVILPEARYDDWLDPEKRPKKTLHGILAHAIPSGYQIQEVSSYVNNWRSQGPRCIEPITPRPSNLTLF